MPYAGLPGPCWNAVTGKKGQQEASPHERVINNIYLVTLRGPSLHGQRSACFIHDVMQLFVGFVMMQSGCLNQGTQARDQQIGLLGRHKTRDAEGKV